jgi:hypothetical protein
VWGASQTDLEGKQFNDSRVGAKLNDGLKQKSGYAHVINCNFICKSENYVYICTIMKYTRYILSDKFIDINSMKTDKILFKFPIFVFKVPVAIVGVFAIFGLMTMTIPVDGARNTKCMYIRFKRRGYRL